MKKGEGWVIFYYGKGTWCIKFGITRHSVSSFKMEFNLLTIRHATGSKHLSTGNNIFNAAYLNYFSFSEEIENVPYS